MEAPNDTDSQTVQYTSAKGTKDRSNHRKSLLVPLRISFRILGAEQSSANDQMESGTCCRRLALKHSMGKIMYLSSLSLSRPRVQISTPKHVDVLLEHTEACWDLHDFPRFFFKRAAPRTTTHHNTPQHITRHHTTPTTNNQQPTTNNDT